MRVQVGHQHLAERVVVQKRRPQRQLLVHLQRTLIPRLGERVDVLRFLGVRRGLQIQVRVAERVRMVVRQQRPVFDGASPQFQRK